MTTPAPNEDSPRQPDPDGDRNDPAIDPDGNVATPPADGDQGDDEDEQTGVNGDASTAEGNTFSPDFEPEQDEDTFTKPKDGDIDTDGG